MSEDSKNIDPPMYEIDSIASPSKSRTKKYIIIAVSVFVAVGIILTAILVGMYLFTDAQKQILKLAYSRDGSTNEEVTSDPNSNTVQYHVTSTTYEMWVVDDFNREIQTAKIHSDSETNCFLTPLNTTMALDPSKVNVPSDLDPKNQNMTYSVSYHAADTPVSDTSFLGSLARQTCQGVSTYWVFPSCNSPSTEPGTKQKRSWHICIKVKVFFAEVEYCYNHK